MRPLCGRVVQTASARRHQFAALQTRTSTRRLASAEAGRLLRSGSFSPLAARRVDALGVFDIRESVQCSGGRRILDSTACTFLRDIPKWNMSLVESAVSIRARQGTVYPLRQGHFPVTQMLVSYRSTRDRNCCPTPQAANSSIVHRGLSVT